MPSPREATSTAAAKTRYETVAAAVTELVRSHVLEAGGRAPSLREIARRHRVSMATAMRAYQVLEERGILQVRPQSGHYVAASGSPQLEVPSKSRPPQRAASVRVSHRVLQLLEYASDQRFVPLGCAIPSPDLLAAEALDRLLARTARTRGRELNTYSGTRGDLRLRQEIARRAAWRGHDLSADDIAITCGCTEALLLALKTVTRPGDLVAVESPTYFGLLHALEMMQLRAVALPTDAVTGVDIAGLTKALAGNPIAACLLSSSFNNPLGCSGPDESRSEIVRALARKKVTLIEDDTYGELFFGREPVRPYSAFDTDGRVIYCGSFSKTIAPGYRVGWIATRRHMDRVLEHKFTTTLANPLLQQAALAEFMASGGFEGHLRRLRRAFASGIAAMSEAIAQSFPAGTRLSRPAGGFALWVQFPTPVDTRALLSKALDIGVCFAPGDVFSADQRFGDCLRLSCGYGWGPRMRDAIVRLGALFASEA
jgi:DNA-binding transcriptional MocR family regulator